MTRIMIVEDDLLTRIGIASMLQNADFEIIAEVDNGKSALEIAIAEKPDIIITDIVMPIMNGIELIRHAKEEGIGSKFVILSSYKDFEYVKEGILLGAEDYILKLELEQESLIALLNKIASNLETQTESEYNENSSQDNVRSDHTKAQCIYNIITGRFTCKQINNSLNICNLPIQEKNLICLLVDKKSNTINAPVDTNASAHSLKLLINLLNLYGEAFGCIVDIDLFCFIVSLKDTSETPATKEHCEKIRKAIYSYIKETFNVEFRLLMSPLFNKFEEITTYFSKMCYMDNGHYYIPNSNQSVEESKYNFSVELNMLETVLNNFNEKSINDAFYALHNKMNSYTAIPAKVLHSICYMLIFFTNKFFIENTHIDNGKWSRSKSILQLNTTCKTYSDYEEFMRSIQGLINESIKSSKENDIAIVSAKNYIADNYNKDITLSKVSSYVNLAPNYFSRLFSKITGKGFLSYLTSLRIEHAQKLLVSTNKKISDISVSVGYSNTYYFCRVFKHETGHTPSEYRKHNRQI